MLTTNTNNLPPQATSLIGRQREVAEVGALLASTRLVTLTGVGGGGKSRLALEVARQRQDQYPDGTWFVELAGLTEQALVPHAVAAALGLQDSGASTVASLLREFMAEKRLLLVLDNCEHLTSACAALADMLLRACPHMQVLATSRQVLGVPWETIWSVPPLSVAEEAVQLFVARARAVRPGFQPTAEVAEICRRLDGIPLAIELAAARARVLSPQQIAVRLDDSLGLLTGGYAGMAPRQQTMRAAIDWSYELLAAAERACFRRLAVFGGSFALEAAEAVCADLPEPTLDLLTQLVDKSLVVPELPRYRLLEPLRQYALARLAEAGEEHDARRRHLAYFGALAAQAAPELTGAAQGVWLRCLGQEHLELQAALEWSVASDPAAGLQLAADTYRYWRNRGAEGRHWLDLLLARVPEPSEVRAWGLLAAGRLGPDNAKEFFAESYELFQRCGNRWGMAWAGWGQAAWLHQTSEKARVQALLAESRAIFADIGDKIGLAHVLGVGYQYMDLEQRRANLQARLALLREAGDQAGLVRALTDLAGLDRHRHDADLAWQRLDEAARLAQEIDDKMGMAGVLMAQGEVVRDAGDFAATRSYYEQGLALYRETDNRHCIAYARLALARLALDTCDGQRTAAILQDVLRLADESGDIDRRCSALVFLSVAQVMVGAFEQAERSVQEAIELAQRQGSGGALAWALRTQGIVLAEQQRWDEALRLQRESLTIERRELGQKPGLALGVGMVGIWLIHRGVLPQGLRLVAAAAAIHPLDSALDAHERPYLRRALDLARTALPPDEFERVWAAGAALQQVAALNEALAEQPIVAQLPGGLTSRELEVVRLVAQGLSDREVGAQLFISPRTVDTHLRNIFTKVNVASRTALVAWAHQNGLIRP